MITAKKYLVIIFFMRGFLAAAQGAAFPGELPLEILPARGKQTFILYLSGDGGLNAFSTRLCNSFAAGGHGVVALNCRKYFWNYKSPENLTSDIERIISHYSDLWHKADCLIVGFSFGADVLAFLPQRLSPKIIWRIKGMALLSPAASTDFVVRISDLLATNSDRDFRRFKVEPELEKNTLSTLCLFGKEETLSLKKDLKPSAWLNVAELPGNHYFNYKTDDVVRRIFCFFDMK